MITQEIYAHVLPAVQMLIQDLNGQLDASRLDQQVYEKLWPYVTHAVREAQPTAPAPTPDIPDRRQKPWQVTVRFWEVTPIDTQLLAETDPEIITGTGKLPALLSKYADEMHGEVPAELSDGPIKERLPQLRNNLGRQRKAVLRIEYQVNDNPYICQVDIVNP